MIFTCLLPDAGNQDKLEINIFKVVIFPVDSPSAPHLHKTLSSLQDSSWQSGDQDTAVVISVSDMMEILELLASHVRQEVVIDEKQLQASAITYALSWGLYQVSSSVLRGFSCKDFHRLLNLKAVLCVCFVSHLSYGLRPIT